MLWDKIRILYYELICKHVKLSRETNTPILFDDYNIKEHYYMINNNKNMIYSLDEMYEIMKKDKPIDPFTRLPIKSWCFVKVSISK
jgi:hypothetical protein